MRGLRLLALVPVVATVVIAGVVSSPAKVKPCVTEFTKGVNGSPTHLISGPGGDLYAVEEPQRKILRFHPDTHETKEYDVKTQPHDLTAGPDGRIWFVSYLDDRFGVLDPKTGEVELFDVIPRDSEPHMVRFGNDGKAYITLQKTGQLARFDPDTEETEVGSFGLPRGNYIHNIVEVPNGDFWAVLQEGDALARFNLRQQRFDKFVKVPIADSGPRDITYARSTNSVYATLFAANKIVQLDLDTDKLTVHDTHLEPISYQDALSRKPQPKLTFIRPDAQEDSLWVATLAGGELLRFNVKSGDITRVGCGVTIPSGPLGLANDSKGRLWYAVPFPKGMIVRVDR